MKSPTSKLNRVMIVKREEIPALTEIIVEGKRHNIGELRDFHKHQLLSQFVPENARLSVSWTSLKESKILKPHQHPEPSMIIICQGDGYILGELEQRLVEGDVVMIPTNCVHGFKGGVGGMHCLSIQLDMMGGLYENPDKPLVTFAETSSNQFGLDELIAFNKECMHDFFDNKFFTMTTDGTLENEKNRKIFLDNLQFWADQNQLLLLSRQAMCSDDLFRTKFLQHFHEEFHHDQMFKDREGAGLSQDPIIDAIASWFVLQMYQLDNVEKAAIIHLVIENGSDYYHKVARPLLNKYVNDKYFEVHEADTIHAKWGIDLLQGYNEKVYLRIKEVIKEAWAMLDAMVSRVVELTEGADND